MAGSITVLDNFKQDDEGNRTASLLFIYEITLGEKKTVNGIGAKPQSALELLGTVPAVEKYNLVNATDQQKFDTGDMVFEIFNIFSRAGEPGSVIFDKARVMYTQKRNIYMTLYARRYAVAGMDIPLP